jgi:DNA excision repair protein ERCC-4
VNTAAIDVLRRLPGVSEANFRPLMAAAGSLNCLADLSLEELAKAMGSKAAAKKLRDWLDAVCPMLP